MNKPFDLPDGMSWRELSVSERSWLGCAGSMGITQENAAAYDIEYRLRHRDTGEERLVKSGGIAHSVERGRDELMSGVAFYYTEGNLGCGCNRTTLWREAGNEPRLSDDESICDQKYDVVWPKWLARCDEDPYLRSEETPPWRAV
jgi:hypothetical protein